MLIGPPNMSSTVERFSFAIEVVEYAGVPETDEGLIPGGAETVTPSLGHFFPVDGETIERLELQNPGAVFGLHVPTPALTAVTKGSTQRASVLRFGGKDYEVKSLQPWLEGPAGTETWQVAVVQEVKR